MGARGPPRRGKGFGETLDAPTHGIPETAGAAPGRGPAASGIAVCWGIPKGVVFCASSVAKGPDEPATASVETMADNLSFPVKLPDSVPKVSSSVKLFNSVPVPYALHPNFLNPPPALRNDYKSFACTFVINMGGDNIGH